MSRGICRQLGCEVLVPLRFQVGMPGPVLGATVFLRKSQVPSFFRLGEPQCLSSEEIPPDYDIELSDRQARSLTTTPRRR